jgi:hypothetical protein
MEKKTPSAVQNEKIINERSGGKNKNQILDGPGNRRTSRAAAAPLCFFGNREAERLLSRKRIAKSELFRSAGLGAWQHIE